LEHVAQADQQSHQPVMEAEWPIVSTCGINGPGGNKKPFSRFCLPSSRQTNAKIVRGGAHGACEWGRRSLSTLRTAPADHACITGTRPTRFNGQPGAEFLSNWRQEEKIRSTARCRPGQVEVHFTVPPGCQRCGSSRRTRRAKRAAREAGCAAAKSTRTIETVPSKRRGSFLTSAPVERPQLPNPWEGDDRSQDPLGGRRAAANLRETIRIVPNERLIVSERVAARDRNFAHVNAEVRELAQMQIWVGTRHSGARWFRRLRDWGDCDGKRDITLAAGCADSGDPPIMVVLRSLLAFSQSDLVLDRKHRRRALGLSRRGGKC